MKKLSLLAAILLGLHLQAQFTVSDAVPLDKGESILASSVTTDGHYYVITGSKTFSTVNGKPVGTKVNVFHFDDQIKLVAQKKVKRPDLGSAPLQIASVYEVGTTLILFGYSEDLARGISKVGYTTVDKTALEISSKTNEIEEIKSGGYFGGGKPYFEFNQSEPGKSVAFMMESSESVPTRNGFTMEKSTHYYLLDTKLVSYKCYSFANSDDPYDQQNAGFIVSASGVLNFIVMEREHVNLTGEWYNDERQLRKLNNAKFSAKFYSYSPENKKLEKSTLTFKDSTLWFSQVRMYEYGSKIFIGGTASNSNFIIQKYFNKDTVGIPEAADYCFLHAAVQGTPNVVLNAACVRIDAGVMKQLSTSEKISKQDRSLGASDEVAVSSMVVTGEGSAVITGASYVESKFPPYEEIKNDPNYDISTDGEGNITRITSSKTGSGVTRRFYSLFRMTFDLAAKTCQVKVLNVEFTTEASVESKHQFASVSSIQTSTTTVGNVYFSDKDGNEIQSWDGSGSAKPVPFPHSGLVHINNEALPSCYFRFMILNGQKSFWLMKVQ